MTISDINTEARALVGADSSSYTAASLLIRVNDAYQEIVTKIRNCDGDWEFDDVNLGTEPIANLTMTESTSAVAVGTAYEEIERLEVKDVDGNYHLLSPINLSDIPDAVSEFYSTPGLPTYYDKKGAYVYLYPAPTSTEATLSSGLRVYYKRNSYLFTSSDVTTGTKEPGFAAAFHILIAYKAALAFAAINVPERVNFLLRRIAEKEEDLINFYSRRNKDIRKRISTRGINHR